MPIAFWEESEKSLFFDQTDLRGKLNTAVYSKLELVGSSFCQSSMAWVSHGSLCEIKDYSALGSRVLSWKAHLK